MSGSQIGSTSPPTGWLRNIDLIHETISVSGFYWNLRGRNPLPVLPSGIEREKKKRTGGRLCMMTSRASKSIGPLATGSRAGFFRFLIGSLVFLQCLLPALLFLAVGRWAAHRRADKPMPMTPGCPISPTPVPRWAAHWHVGCTLHTALSIL